YRSLLIEDIAETSCTLLREENETLRKRKPDYLRSIAHRLSFFKTPPDETPGSADFLGYVIYKIDFFSIDPRLSGHVYECVIAPFRGSSWNNYVHCLRTYEVRNAAGVFTIAGVLYARQNDLTLSAPTWRFVLPFPSYCQAGTSPMRSSIT